MKILITGMTARHCGTARDIYVTVIEPLIEMLEKYMGHNVTQRMVNVNEDLSEYDKIIAYLFPIEKLGCTRRYAIFDLINRYPEKTILSFDDWQYFQFHNYVRNCIDSGRFWNWVDKYPEFITKGDYKAIIKGGESVRNTIEETAIDMIINLQLPVLMPLFTWGDISKVRIKTSGPVIIYDPSLYAIDWVKENYGEYFPGEKNKKWICASLFNHEKYTKELNLEWPIYNIGHKKTTGSVSERRLCSLYEINWGIISPKYQMSGDGWWRARWIFSYIHNNIIHASIEEQGKLPSEFFPNNFASNPEAVSKCQKEILYDHFMKKEQVKDIISDILK